MEKTRKTVLVPADLDDWVKEQARKNNRSWSAEALTLIQLGRMARAKSNEAAA